MLINNYILALVLSIAIEIAVAYVIGFKEKKYLLAVAMINCITNPLVNYSLLMLASAQYQVTFTMVCVFEVAVVFAEWGLLVHTFGHPKGRLFMLSLFANAMSFVVGLLIFWI
jgi:hypothetical protein